MADQIYIGVEYLQNPLANLAALKAIDTTAPNVNDGVAVNVKTLGWFNFDSTSVEANNNVTVVQPTTGSGRWLKMAAHEVANVDGVFGNSNAIPVLTYSHGDLQSIATVPPTGIYRLIPDSDTTLQATDQNGTVVFTGSSASTCTIPTFASASIPVNAIIKVCNKTLSTTIAPAGGVTLVGGTFTFYGTNTTAYLQQTSTNIWELLNPSELPLWSHLQFTDTTKDLAYSDQFNWQIYFNSVSTTITVQPFLSVPFQIGATINYLQKSTGNISFAAGSGVTFLSNSSGNSTTNTGDMVILRHESTNVWSISVISGMASQAPAAVAITGGTINNTTIGATTAVAGTFSTINAKQPSGFTGANAIQQVAGVQTTNATQTVLASVLVNQTESITLSGTITAAQSDHTNAVGGTFSITARRASGGNVTLIGSVVTSVQSSSAATFTCAVDTGTQTVRILVTGVAATTYNWVTNYTYQKVLTNT